MLAYGVLIPAWALVSTVTRGGTPDAGTFKLVSLDGGGCQTSPANRVRAWPGIAHYWRRQTVAAPSCAAAPSFASLVAVVMASLAEAFSLGHSLLRHAASVHNSVEHLAALQRRICSGVLARVDLRTPERTIGNSTLSWHLLRLCLLKTHATGSDSSCLRRHRLCLRRHRLCFRRRGGRAALRPWGLVEQVFDIVDQLVGGLSFRVRGGRGDQSGHQQKQRETSHPASLSVQWKAAPEHKLPAHRTFRTVRAMSPQRHAMLRRAKPVTASKCYLGLGLVLVLH